VVADRGGDVSRRRTRGASRPRGRGASRHLQHPLPPEAPSGGRPRLPRPAHHRRRRPPNAGAGDHLVGDDLAVDDPLRVRSGSQLRHEGRSAFPCHRRHGRSGRRLRARHRVPRRRAAAAADARDQARRAPDRAQPPRVCRLLLADHHGRADLARRARLGRSRPADVRQEGGRVPSDCHCPLAGRERQVAARNVPRRRARQRRGRLPPRVWPHRAAGAGSRSVGGRRRPQRLCRGRRRDSVRHRP